MNIKFKTTEYTADDDFVPSEYEFSGDENSGWQIFRNNREYLRLGKGYKLLKSRLCGICSTDLSRRFLPFPLPQIIGHEVVAEGMDEKEKFVVEINDTPYYREDEIQDTFSRNGLYTHTPGRMVLGIDRLPGGFGPYLLAPKKSIISAVGLNEYAAVLIKPFAAALQAIIASPPKTGHSVAVLGPRRLGSLVIAALTAYRKSSGKDYKITAIARHKHILNLCMKLGADDKIDLSEAHNQAIGSRFDIVYDTTGSVSGFQEALKLTNTEIHLKSTNGLNVCGLDNLTAFVVDELSLLPYSIENLEFTWKDDNRRNKTVYLSPGVNGAKINEKNVYKGDVTKASNMLTTDDFQSALPRFDIAVASSLDEIDGITRPSRENECSLVRPRGAILFKGDPSDNMLLNFISKGGRIRSSRCGDFHLALELLRNNNKITEDLPHFLISHVFPANELKTAFQFAQNSKSFKVIAKHP